VSEVSASSLISSLRTFLLGTGPSITAVLHCVGLRRLLFSLLRAIPFTNLREKSVGSGRSMTLN